MIKYLFPFLFFVTITNAEDINLKIEPSADCLILQDENSIICKFETNRTLKDRKIIVQWIDPQGDVSRSRNMLIPAGHASIYDYRYINGRLKGSWTFKVIENEKSYITSFKLQ